MRQKLLQQESLRGSWQKLAHRCIELQSIAHRAHHLALALLGSFARLCHQALEHGSIVSVLISSCILADLQPDAMQLSLA